MATNMSDNKWETVTRKKNASAAEKKAARKGFDSNPAVDIAPPLETSKTLYSQFQVNDSSPTTEAGNSQFNGSDASKKNVSDVQQKKSQPKKKKEVDKKKDKFVSLESALKTLDGTEIKAQLLDVKNRCPDAPSLWLGDLVGFLNRKLEVKETDTVFTNQPPDHPLCKVGKHIRDLIKSTLKSYSDEMLRKFFDYCVQEKATDLGKGQPVNGYRIFIQILAREHPHFVTDYMPMYLDLVKQKKNDRPRCLSILWSCGQAGLADPIVGLKVWSGLMLPMLGHKIVSPYAVAYLEGILRTVKQATWNTVVYSQTIDMKQAYKVIGPNEFFPMLDFVFTPSNSLPATLQKQLMKHYPTLQSIAFGANPEETLRLFFPSLLARFSSTRPESLKNELLKCLVLCLHKDQHCFSKWRQMYVNNMAQSGVLMAHLLTEWDQVQRKLNKKMLRETVKAFSLTNEELAEEKTGHQDYEECKLACKDLLEKMSGFEFPWRPVIMITVVAVIGFMSFDFYTHGGFQGSHTENFLVKSGLMAISTQAWQKIAHYMGEAWMWLNDNVPIYYSRATEICQPYLILAWGKMYAAWIWCVDVTIPVWTWLAEQIPLLIQWILDRVPLVWEVIQYYLSIAWNFVHPYVVATWTYIYPILRQIAEFLVHYATIGWTTVSPYVNQTWNSLQQTFRYKTIISKPYVS